MSDETKYLEAAEAQPIMPKRIQLRRTRGWRLPAEAVNVARPGPWGNPFVVGKHGTRAECVDLYEKLLAGLICLSNGPAVAEQRRARDHVLAHMDELRGKDLACWCRLDGKPCHGDVLLRLANGDGATR